MAKAILPAGYNNPGESEPLEIELREPWVAALLAWLIPGAGHLYQGRTAKGVLFFVCIMGTFAFGLVIGGGKVVYANSTTDQPWRWQYYCQAGVGLPAAPALLQKGRRANRPHPLLGKFMAPPSNEQTEWKDDSGKVSTQPNELAKWMVEQHPRYEIGTVFTVVAGLLNILVICDAYGGPLVIAPREKKKPDDGESSAEDTPPPPST